MLNVFTYHNGACDDGHIYDLYSGKTYNCALKLKDGKPNIWGYIGVPLFGHSITTEKIYHFKT
ncbi:DUF2147 domain-containing protein [Mucilaginibacter mallensis]|uniref:DUF2147 domain-containing protein n=1 Tax=Mucilaginibacter mallensis TaxID=652787 RepID=UPI0012F75759